MLKINKERLLLIGNLMTLNFLWIIFSLPILTIGASNSALYTNIKRIRRGRYKINIRDYWEDFRKDFIVSTKAWIILLGVFISNFFGLVAIIENRAKIHIIYLGFVAVGMLLFGIISQYIFLLIAEGKKKLKELFFVSLILGTEKFHYSLLFMFFYIVNIIIFLFFPIVFTIIWPLYVIVGFSMTAFLKLKSIGM